MGKGILGVAQDWSGLAEGSRVIFLWILFYNGMDLGQILAFSLILYLFFYMPGTCTVDLNS